MKTALSCASQINTHKHRNHYSPILTVLLRRFFKTSSSFWKQQLQNNSDWAHTMPGSTASCCALQSLAFTWCEGPADWVTRRLGKQSISAHKTGQEKLIGLSERACCVLCQRDRKGTQHQPAAGSTVNLQEDCCAQITTCRPLYARSFPDSIHTLRCKYARHSMIGHWNWLCWEHTIRQDRSCYASTPLYSTQQV